MQRISLCLVVAAAGLAASVARGAPEFRAELVFPLHARHNHAAGIVECPNGDLLVSWYRGSGERSADDVAVMGARWTQGAGTWSEPFVMADNPGFPDCNTCMMIDNRQKLWLFWPIVLDNHWESALTNYRTSTDYSGAGPPNWNWQGVIWLKPTDFKDKATSVIRQNLASRPQPVSERGKAYVKRHLEELEKHLGEILSQRLGWQPRCKPTVLSTGRILLPLYSDTFSFSLMAISDDEGRTWYASEPLMDFGGAIQPAVLERKDGSLVAYMRVAGPLLKVRVAESRDAGLTWGPVGTIKLPNPGSGLDAVRLADGNWLLIYNDTIIGRKSLAVSLSEDEGKTWKFTRNLERHKTGSYSYPAIIQGADGTIHAVYSYSVDGGKSIKHVAFNEEWVKAQDAK
jgi:arylsulfatase A